ncbi:MAG: hypothetical protein COX62_04185 [Deltaproteobacteria bacterium CG_4_10_14_0_2_um_filter_43_8]|nr:MAG: hypothetical protein COV46_08165 [Deltaproteobacteria bacterium CG11_big_fil_rev_8_21_14_0_20_49_13]PJA20708.1 MAG: hypothetical protein COX62_04185 [Deltaproteobacteria bacterium CG_4_10_14_0_2_um_filter_43_8]
MTIKKAALITALDPENPYSRIAVNLGLLNIAASVKTKVDVHIVDSLGSIFRLRPDIVGISSVTENYGRAINMAKEIKMELNVPIVIGGTHISALPESLDRVFSAGIIGEGEETFSEILSRYPDLSKVDGLVRWSGDSLAFTPSRRMIKCLDSLPLPDWKRWVERPGLPYVMTSRGCPYKCSFCSSPVQWGSVRLHSPERVLQEIRLIRELYGSRHIKFFDDIFILDKKRVKKIVEMIDSEGLNKRITFSCFSRADLIDKETAALLLKGNVRFVSLGIESGSSKVAKALKGTCSAPAHNQRVVDMLHTEGFYTGCLFIIGSPTETEKDLIKTLKFIEKNEKKMFEIEINPYIVRPGTPFWKKAVKKKLVYNEMNWELLKDYSLLNFFDPDRYVYVNEHMPYEKFLEYVERFKEIFKRVVMDPKKMSMFRGLIGPEDIPVKLAEEDLSS